MNLNRKKMEKKVFLTASWEHLIMANYEINPDILKPFVPAGTEPDFFAGKSWVSLVGFLFNHVRLKGISVPFHTRFAEVNLRFYVRRKENGQWKRGVVFISEIVPKRMISLVANTLYKEHYRTLPVIQLIGQTGNQLWVSYKWKTRKKEHTLGVKAAVRPEVLQSGSFEEFITEHYWGYSGREGKKTVEYQVDHPRWDIHPVEDFTVDCDFEALYGSAFGWMNQASPASVFLAHGSPVRIFNRS